MRWHTIDVLSLQLNSNAANKGCSASARWTSLDQLAYVAAGRRLDDAKSHITGFDGDLHEFHYYSTLLQAFCRERIKTDKRDNSVCSWYDLDDGEFEQRGDMPAPSFEV